MFRQRPILLGYIIHLGDRQVNLLDALELFIALKRYFGYELIQMLDVNFNFLERFAGLDNQLAAVLDFLDRIDDLRLNFFRCGCGSPGKVAHFAHHHGKAAALSPCPCRLDRRI